jgi:uncharacterized ubiquitin-like protein YukD
MNFFTIFFLFIAAAICVMGYEAQDLFDLLPQKDGWKRLSKTLKNDKEVPKYVHIYAGPFKQLQKAARNETIPVNIIKRSVLVALHLTLEASKTFKLRKRDFRSRDMKDIRSMIKKALTTYDLRIADKLAPVFTPNTLKSFASQRFEDMFFAHRHYDNFQKEHKKFEAKLKQLRSDIKKSKGSDLRHLILITADIEEVQKRTIKNLISFRKEVDYMKQDDLQKAETRVKKLGSGGSLLKSDATFLAIGVAVFCILF